jgi:hypothetical protein
MFFAAAEQLLFEIGCGPTPESTEQPLSHHCVTHQNPIEAQLPGKLLFLSP